MRRLTTRTIALLALLLSLLANMMGLYANAALGVENCDRVELVKTEIRLILLHEQRELRNGEYDERYQWIYGEEWERHKEADIRRYTQQVNHFSPKECTILGEAT